MSSAKNTNTQVVVIGAGPGGYAAAFRAADLGKQVTLIDLDKNPGGVCLYRGCIPSKALLHVAKILNESKEAADFGVDFKPPKIDLDKMRAWKNDVVGKMTGGLGELCKRRNINFIQGRAQFKDSNTLDVERVDGGKETVTFENAILATGSKPARIPSLWIDSPRMMDSTGALEIADIPKSLLVVGGGYIGLELGTVYASLGTEVTVVEMTAGLLPGADRDLVKILAARANKIFKSVLLETRVVEIAEKAKKLHVKFHEKDGNEVEQSFDKVLMSVGRTPNSKNLGLENTKVKVNDKGFVEVDINRRTADPAIFAIGDIAGEPMLAHKGSHEGLVAAEVIAGHKAAFEPLAIPAVVFTDPEIAWCGLTETQAKEAGRKVEVARFPWGASGRATTLGRNDGVTKIIADPETERILGLAIAGSGAGELISEGVLAIEMGAVVSDVKLTIHPHPTLSETVMESAELFFGQCTHLYRPKKS